MGILDQTVTLSGRLVSLRPIGREDYPTLFRWRSSLEIVHMLNFRRNIATYEQFVAILTVQRQYEELAATHPDGHPSESAVESGGVT